MSQPSQQKFDYELFSRVIALAKPYKGIFATAGILAVVLAPLSTLRPYLIKVMVDDYIFNYDIDGMTKIAILIVVILVLNVVLQYAFIYSTSWLGQSVIKDLRVNVFQHITSLKLKYFDKTPIGTSTTRTINDIETINTVFSQGVITILADLLTLFAVLGIMFYTSWKLTVVCLVTMPFLIIAT
ncbi:MAG: ABC transporter transmembrane domain-containing protein, partial [Bacteroidota bacterium]